MDDAQPFDTPRAQFRIARRGLVRSHPADALRMMRGQATRQAIVEAARRLFNERGYFATKVDDIATLARVKPLPGTTRPSVIVRCSAIECGSLSHPAS